MKCTRVGSLAREKLHGAGQLPVQRSSLPPHNCVDGASTSCLVLSGEGQGHWRQDRDHSALSAAWAAGKSLMSTTCGYEICPWEMGAGSELECQSHEQREPT